MVAFLLIPVDVVVCRTLPFCWLMFGLHGRSPSSSSQSSSQLSASLSVLWLEYWDLGGAGGAVPGVLLLIGWTIIKKGIQVDKWTCFKSNWSTGETNYNKFENQHMAIHRPTVGGHPSSYNPIWPGLTLELSRERQHANCTRHLCLPTHLGRVVQKAISANPGLKFNRPFMFGMFCLTT